jgi:uncharacterized DUF497 family protein
VDYEWDSAKAAENLRRHGIDFRDAIPAIEDPNRLEDVDDRFDYGEERILIVGRSAQRVLFVVTTSRDEDVCRIISARRATRREEDRYYAGDDDGW